MVQAVDVKGDSLKRGFSWMAVKRGRVMVVVEGG